MTRARTVAAVVLAALVWLALIGSYLYAYPQGWPDASEVVR